MLVLLWRSSLSRWACKDGSSACEKEVHSREHVRLDRDYSRCPHCGAVYRTEFGICAAVLEGPDGIPCYVIEVCAAQICGL